MTDVPPPTSREQLENELSRLTAELHGQFPRPWMTEMHDPENAKVFIVGHYQATKFLSTSINHRQHMDSLFNRKNRSCNATYELMRGEKGPSRTRHNINKLTRMLLHKQISSVIETNIVCFSKDTTLTKPQRREGFIVGRDIFCTLLRLIKPKVLIVNGSAPSQAVARQLGLRNPQIPNRDDMSVRSARAPISVAYRPLVFFTPSLGGSGWNRWSSWADAHLEEICSQIPQFLSGGD
jgi:hypothetical protein